MKRVALSLLRASLLWPLAALLITIGSLGAFAGQSGNSSVWNGVFTEEQAERGKDAYLQECASCHLDDLLGDGIAPSLSGAAFNFRWNDLAVGDMFASIRATMPQGAPASLSPQAYIDIISYILKENGLPQGETELPPAEEVLNTILIQDKAADDDSSETGDRSVRDGVFTTAQAARGKMAYEQECAPCHLDDLLGDGIAPSLTGAAFDFRWSELSVGNMFSAIRATMPQGAPASLSPQAYVDIVSYILEANDLPAGDSELPIDEAPLNEIIITAEQ